LGTRGEDCDDNGACRGAASAAAVAARRRAPGDGPAFTKASAVAKADELADKTAGKHSCPHAQELITFPPTQKTDWGKKRRILKIYFNHGSTGLTRIWGSGKELMESRF